MNKKPKSVPVPPTPSEAAFELGRKIVRFDWFATILTFTGSKTAARRAQGCLTEVERSLAVLLLPSTKAGRCLCELEDQIGSFASREVNEQIADAWSDAGQSPEDAAKILKSDLTSLLPAKWDQLWSGLTGEIQDLESLYQWANLGRCLERGLFPQLSVDDLVRTKANPEWTRFAKLQESKPGKAFTEPPSELVIRNIPVLGGIPPASSWTVELSALWNTLALPQNKLVVSSQRSARARQSDNAKLASVIKKLIPCPGGRRKGSALPAWVKGTRWSVSPSLDAFAIHGQVSEYRVKLELQVLNVLAESDEAPSSEEIVDQIPNLKTLVERNLEHPFEQRIDRFRPLRSVIGKLNDRLADILKLGKRRLITSQRRGQKRHVWMLGIPPLAAVGKKKRER